MRWVKVREIANYLICAAAQNGKPLTNLEVLKLLYYAQGWFLALYDRPLFNEKLRAWRQGPVQPSVYQEFKHFGWHPIDVTWDPPQVPQAIKNHVDTILDVFGSYGAMKLKRMTHSESPWLNARRGYPSHAPSNTVISVDDMKQFFIELLKGRHVEQQYEWAREALKQQADKEESRFGETLSWVNQNYGEALQRLAK